MKIKLVTGTMSDSKTYEQLPIIQSYNKLKKLGDIDIEIFLNNKLGLSEIYNQAIEKHKDDCDVLLFAHDDLFISDLFLFEKLEDAFSKQKFDIVGIAGTDNISLINPRNPNAPISWANSNHKGWGGFVEHPLETKNQDSDLYLNVYGSTPKNAATIDGLFIACDTKIFKNPNVRFDPLFNFDFYDLDFCLTSHQENVSIGIYGIFCRHLSRGAGILSPKYREIEKLFLNKWKKK
jgi:hypothetical protein